MFLLRYLTLKTLRYLEAYFSERDGNFKLGQKYKLHDPNVKPLASGGRYFGPHDVFKTALDDATTEQVVSTRTCIYEPVNSSGGLRGTE